MDKKIKKSKDMAFVTKYLIKEYEFLLDSPCHQFIISTFEMTLPNNK